MSNEKDSKDFQEQLNLKVLGQDGQVVQFKIKKATPLRKLMNAYCDRCKLAQNTIRFMFDGSRIDETDTPKSMDMEDGDTIEVFTQQSGGGRPQLLSSCQSSTAAAAAAHLTSPRKLPAGPARQLLKLPTLEHSQRPKAD